MSEHIAPVINLFTRKPELPPQQREHLEKRMADIEVEIVLLHSERARLRRLLGGVALGKGDDAS